MNPPTNPAIAIIPEPLSLNQTSGYFELHPTTPIVAAEPLAELARLFAASLAPALGFSPRVAADAQGAGKAIHLRLDPGLAHLGPEGYRLVVGVDQVDLAASAPAGLFYGTQTIRQLLPTDIFSPEPVAGVKWLIPALEIEDMPRFAWRGALLDVGRHFIPKDFVLRWLDLLALHKINTLHWHLTDDQGWRLEIKKYPRLTEVGAWRKETISGHLDNPLKKYDGVPHGGFYTQADIREVVEYARQRFITIVPEIEMPGHAQAAIAAYPELGNLAERLEVSTSWGVNRHICNVEESTIQFMQDVMSEVLELFPSPYIHIGGDEVPTDEWRTSPAAQKRLKELGLKQEGELQGYFNRCMESFLRARGRRLVGWDEILENEIPTNAAIMSWRCNGSDVEAVKKGHSMIAASYKDVYLDYYQLKDTRRQPLAIGGYTPLSKVYRFEPLSKKIPAEKRDLVLGVQAQLWSEYISTPAQMEYMAFPRLCALAEVAWSSPERKDYAGFVQRLAEHQRRLDGLKVNYCREIE